MLKQIDKKGVLILKKEIKYYVIGGQYDRYNYGGTSTLLGAKRLATKNMEYWDNQQSWHKPNIYLASDCKEYTNFFGTNNYPIRIATPVATWDSVANKWR